MPAPRGVFAALSCLLVLVAVAASPAASVTWPPSAGLVIAEVVTGGVSASDEYVEIANAGPATQDLNGLEVVYASASGATVTRKAVFTSPLLLEPNRHFLIANSAGIYAAGADATYSGGMAADGGAVALRHAGGDVVDSVGWGTATSTFVEGRAAAAPPAKSSIERLPGGSGGNLQDTNDNSADLRIQPNPVPQSRACDPVPAPTPTATPTVEPTPTLTASPTATIEPTATPTPTPAATDEPTPTASPTPTVEPTTTATASPSPNPTPTPTVEPSTSPTASPTPTPSSSPSPTASPTVEPSPTDQPTPEPTPSPTASPSSTPLPTCSITPTPIPTSTPMPTPTQTPASTPKPTPTQTSTHSAPTATPKPTATPSSRPTRTPAPTATEPPTVSVAAARAMAVGSRVHVVGVVAAGFGVLGDAALIAIADDSAGIFVRFSDKPEGLVSGREVELVGILAAPYGQLEIRSVSRLSQGSVADAQEPARIDLVEVGEATEASLVEIRGTVESAGSTAGRIMLQIVDVDDSEGVRVYATASTGLAEAAVHEGDTVSVIGIVGQRASGRGRLDGYRVWLRGAADLVVRAPIAPDPSGGAGTTPPRTAAPTPSASRTPAHELAAALGTKGAAVDVEAVVTAPAGLFEIDGPTIVVDDGTASVAVVLPDGAAAPSIGSRIHLAGKVGRWETGPIVRASAVEILGAAASPEPIQISTAPSSGVEWRLVRIYGRIDKTVRAGTRWRLEVLVGGQSVAVVGEPAAGTLPSDTNGRMVTITGIVRRSTSDSSLFQILPRTSTDVRLGPAPRSGTALPAAVSSASASLAAEQPANSLTPLSELSSHEGARITVAGVVTDAGDGEVTVEDGTGSARVGGEAAAAQIELLEPGDAVEIGGTVSQDDLGPILLADPESVIVLPALAPGSADPASAGTTPAGASALTRNPVLAGASPASDTDTSRRSSSSNQPADLATVLAVVMLAVVGMLGAAALLLARRARSIGGPSSPDHPDE